MRALAAQLESALSGRVCFVGLGNVQYGDDGFGVRLAEELIESALQDVVIAGTALEQRLGSIMDQGFDQVVFLDAVECGAAAGSLVLLNTSEMAARFPQISTHKISLELFARWIESNGRTRVWLLGVQPESITQGSGVTAAVARTMKIVRDLLSELCSQPGNRPAADVQAEVRLPV
jgi:hydrogenase maturation protease